MVTMREAGGTNLSAPNTHIRDMLGRDSSDRIVRPGSTAWPSFNDTLLRAFRVTKRNGRGQILTSADASSLSGALPTVTYDSVGRLLRSRLVQKGYTNVAGAATQYVAGDTMTYDGLGNLLTAKNGWMLGSTSNSETSINTYTTTTGRLAARATAAATAQFTYDAAGNTRFEATVRSDGTRSLERASYYGADDRLLAVDTRTPGQQLLEEYRYDALGRRVWLSTRWRCASSTNPACIANAVTRTVWDGVSEVAEIRARYDTAAAATEALDQGAPLVPESLVRDANPFYGRVVYGPGLALDQPLSVTRYEYRDNPSGTPPAQAWPRFTLVPFWDYRGTPAFGLYADGKTWLPFGTGGTACAAVGTGTATRCVNLTWPFAGSAYHQDRGLVLTLSWHGSLLLKKRDASGLTYLRNRMYDAATGRFTQEDPIGLAGGPNAYGFAGGDPVTYSDPFGLYIDVQGKEAQLAIIRLLRSSPTFRRIYVALFNAHQSRVNVTVREASSEQDFRDLANSGSFGAARADRSRRSPNGRILFYPPPNGVANLVTWFSHEFVHTAGQYAKELGSTSNIPAVCGEPHLGTPDKSQECVEPIEKQIDSERKEYEAAEAARSKAKKP